MTAMTSEREAFEKWLTEDDTNPESPPRDKHDRYVEQDVRHVWSAWQARAHLAQPAQAVDAWMTEDGRVISDRQKATALKDSGASASSVAPYSIPLTRALSGEKAGPVDGWKLVPVEPTQEMIDRGTDEHECEQGDSYYRAPSLSDTDAIAIYKAMLSASPAPDKED